MLGAWQLPVAPNLAAPFILAMNDSFSNHRRFRERMLQHMAEGVRAVLFKAGIVMVLMQRVLPGVAHRVVMLIHIHSQ